MCSASKDGAVVALFFIYEPLAGWMDGGGWGSYIGYSVV